MKKRITNAFVILSILILIMGGLNPSESRFTKYVRDNRSAVDTNINVDDGGRAGIADAIQNSSFNYDLENRIIYYYKSLFLFSFREYIEDRNPE